MTTNDFDAIVARATEIWQARHPGRSAATMSAARQIGALLTEARRQIQAER